jgi:hypothetical protein
MKLGKYLKLEKLINKPNLPEGKIPNRQKCDEIEEVFQ